MTSYELRVTSSGSACAVYVHCWGNRVADGHATISPHGTRQPSAPFAFCILPCSGTRFTPTVNSICVPARCKKAVGMLYDVSYLQKRPENIIMIAYRIGQFMAAMSASVSGEEYGLAAETLTDAELRLFELMPLYDQRHCLDVYW